MIKLAANIDWLWKELPLQERLKAAKSQGFRFVESLNPYAENIENWQVWLNEYQLQLVLINAPPGSSASASVRGLAAWPGRESEFKDAFSQAVEYALALERPIIHATAGPRISEIDSEQQQRCYEINLKWACSLAEKTGITITIEPLSPRDSPGAYMSSLPKALETISNVNCKSLKLQFDLYHQQILHGDIISNLRLAFDQIGHIQVAGVPHRNEPSEGELNFDRVTRELTTLGYSGFIGCEYKPSSTTEEGLSRWASGYLSHSRPEEESSEASRQ